MHHRLNVQSNVCMPTNCMVRTMNGNAVKLAAKQLDRVSNFHIFHLITADSKCQRLDIGFRFGKCAKHSDSIISIKSKKYGNRNRTNETR